MVPNQNEDYIKQFNELFDIPFVSFNDTKEYAVDERGNLEYTELPDFLSSVLAAQFRPKLPTKMEDYRLRTIFGSSPRSNDKNMSPEVHQKFLDLWGIWVENFNLIIIDTDAKTKDSDIFTSSLALNSLSELKKLQLLMGAPLYSHVLSINHHYKYEDIPSGFDLNEFAFVKRLEPVLSKICNYDKSLEKTFKLPISTSQGLTLKSKRDTPWWRSTSKSLLAAYSLNSTSYEHLLEFFEKINFIFTQRRYGEVAQHAFLGLRRQQVKFDKPEYAVRDVDLTMRGYSNVYVTHKIQGRARAIFPFSEAIKAWYKPMADQVKKGLFSKSYMCNVDVNLISAKLHVITHMCQKYDLFSDIEGNNVWLPFYDLSEWDRSAHLGCNAIYEDAMFNCMHIPESRYKLMHNMAGIIYPATLEERFPMLCIDRTEGRSILSGQSDVTVKNNVTHMLLAVKCISTIKQWDEVDVCNALMFNDGPLRNMIIPLMHGDDTAIFFSQDKQDYLDYVQMMTDFGIKCAFEIAPTYLKKNCSEDILRYISTKSDDELFSLCDKVYRQPGESPIWDKIVSNGAKQSGSYNYKYMKGLQPVFGSILKNRFGEYDNSDFVLSYVSLSDTAKLLCGHENDYMKTVYATQLRILCLYAKFFGDTTLLTTFSYLAPCFEDDFDTMSLDSIWSILNIPLDNPEFLQYMKDISNVSGNKSFNMRSMLTKTLHTYGEDFLDDSLLEIYSGMEYDPNEEMKVLKIEKLTREDILQLIVVCQEFILDHDGIAPEEHQFEQLVSSVKQTN